MLVDFPAHKNSKIYCNNIGYDRFLVRTPRIDGDTDLVQSIIDSCASFVQEHDILCIAESVVAITQQRAYKISDITPGFTARLLSRFVAKTPAGIGLGMSETMQLAVEEVGAPRLYLAALVSALGKLVGRKGDFYRVAGARARGIDGPTPGTLPPYNEYATLLPDNPRAVVQEIERAVQEQLGIDIEVIIVDANDIGVNIVGARDKKQEQKGICLSQDNPMGQGHEQTPLMLARTL